MKILFLGDPSPNRDIWVKTMLELDSDLEVVLISLIQPRNPYLKLLRVCQWCLWLFRINNFVRKVDFDLVIGYRLTSYGFMASFIKGKKIVVAAQGAHFDIWPNIGLFSKFKRILVNRVLKKADLIHFWGDNMMEEGYLKNPLKALVLPKGIDLSVYNNLSRAIELEWQNKRVFSFISTRSLSKDYNHKTILFGLNAFKKYNIPFKYTIAGSGPLEEELKSLTRVLGLQNDVVFVGKLNPSDLSLCYQKCDIYISLPSTEGVSASLFEAMACGCYPIVSDLPSYHAFIEDGHNGRIIRNDNEECIADIIFSCLQNYDKFVRALEKNVGIVNKIGDSKKNIKIFLDEYENLLNNAN